MNTRNLAIASSLLLVMGCKTPSYAPYGSATTGNQVISAPNTASGTALPEYSGSAESESDRALEARIQQAFHDNSLGFTPNVNPSARNGVVQLTGTVPNESSRLAVDNLVRNTTGVVSVMDRMQVANPPRGYTAPTYSSTDTYTPATPYPPSGYVTTPTGDIFSLHVQGLNDTDRTLAQRVLDGLRTDSALSTLLPSVNITIVNGRVVLQGTVQNERQRRAIAEAVERAAGVQNVDNELVINR